MKKIILISSFFIVTLLSAYDSFNISEKKQYIDSIKNFNKKFYNQAYLSFEELNKNYPNNPLIKYYYARSAYELGKYDIALEQYKVIMQIQPNNKTAEIELAQTYKALNQKEEARKIYTKILAYTISDNLENIIIKKLQELDESKNSFKSILITGIEYDSNANNYSKDNTYNIYIPSQQRDVDVELNTHRNSDKSLYLISSTDHIYKYSDSLDLKNNFTFFGKKYDKFDNNDPLIFSLSTMPSYFTNTYRVGVKLKYDRIFVDGDSYLQKFSLIPTYSRVLNKNFTYEVQTKFTRNEFIDKQRDSIDYELINKIKHYTKDFGIFTYAIGLGKEKEIRDQRTDVSNDYYSLFISNSFKLPYEYFLYSSYRYNKQINKEKDENFLSKRDNKRQTLTLNITKPITENMAVSFGTQFIDNSSNQEPYEYDKYLLNAQLIYSF